MATRILVVEDDLLNRMFLCATLETGGYEVRMATDGDHVLAAAREFDPDLITMDINLPNISGVQLIRRLKADPKFRDVPVLAITAYVGRGEEREVRRAGAADFLAKPISIKSLLGSVASLLEQPHPPEPDGPTALPAATQDPPSHRGSPPARG
jgi:two-component system cell cycle response regulator DivK